MKWKANEIRPIRKRSEEERGGRRSNPAIQRIGLPRHASCVRTWRATETDPLIAVVRLNDEEPKQKRDSMRYITILAAMLLAQGCAYFTHKTNPAGIVSFAQLKHDSGSKNNLLWYMGRKGEYDYFKYVYGGLFDERTFKIKAGAIPLGKIFRLTDDTGQWITVHTIDTGWQFKTFDEE